MESLPYVCPFPSLLTPLPHVHTTMYTHMMVLKTVTGVLDYGGYDGPPYSLHYLREVSPLMMVLFEVSPGDCIQVTCLHNKEYVCGHQIMEPCDQVTC